MNIVITGAAGFLGTRVANALLAEDSKLPVAKLLLVDVVRPQPHTDTRVSTLAIDLSQPSAANLIIKPDIHVLFHLAALVSGHAEADFDLGLHINFDATRALAEAARYQAPLLRFIFTSTVGVFGGNLPSVIDDLTATTPQNSYGSAKAMCELLLNDYGRRGFADTRIIRLPTVSIRPGIPNKAVTSFASGIIREPLNGEESICPVDVDLKLWLTSPCTVVQNIIHAATLPREVFGSWRVINLPGISVSVSEMIQALREVAGDKVASLIRFEPIELVARIVGSFPDIFDNTRALGNGFIADKSFKEMILMYIRDDLKQ